MSLIALRHTRTALPADRPLTVDDLEHTPDDGRGYELVDGRLDVSAAAAGPHTRAEGRLIAHRGINAPEGFEVHPDPGLTLNRARTSHRVPDLAVLRTERFTVPYPTGPPGLVVEVLSPDSVFRDTHTKRGEYAAFGVPCYWIVNPSPEKPGLLALRLEKGGYREEAQVFGSDVFETDLPFPIRIVPEWLVADGPWQSSIAGPAEEADPDGGQ